MDFLWKLTSRFLSKPKAAIPITTNEAVTMAPITTCGKLAHSCSLAIKAQKLAICALPFLMT